MTYREIAVGDLPDADWVAAKAVPELVPNVYADATERGCIEISPVWWNVDAAPAGVGAAVYDAAVVELQPVEVKRVRLPAPVVVGDTTYEDYVAVVAAAASYSKPAFEKVSLEDTSADEMHLRVVSATAPVGATHLRLIVEVTR